MITNTRIIGIINGMICYGGYHDARALACAREMALTLEKLGLI